MSNSETLLIVGCGDIGGELGLAFARRGWRVVGLRRNIRELPAAIEGLAVDLEDGVGLEQLSAIPASYVVMTLTPVEYSEQGYRRIFEQGLIKILQHLDRRSLKRLLFASSTSVYHQNDSSEVDENSPTEPSGFSGQSILRAEKLLRASGLPVTLLRFGGIYGPGRSQLLQQVLDGRCAPPLPPHYSNRIHRDDCVGVFAHLIDRDIAGEALADCYLAVDEAPTPIADVQRWLAQRLAVPYRHVAKRRRRAGSKRCSSQRLRDTGFEFLYPDYRAGYEQLLSEGDPEP